MGSVHVFAVLVFTLWIADQTSANIIPVGVKQTYAFENTVELLDIHENANSSIYKIAGELSASSIWNRNGRHLTKFELNSPDCKAQILGRANNDIPLNSCNINPFYVLFIGNLPKAIHSEEQDVSLINMQKGIANLFYVDVQSTSTTEPSVSGNCSVIYKKLYSDKTKKYLKDCTGWMQKPYHRLEKILDTKVDSSHEIDYEFSQTGELRSIIAVEQHKIKVAMTENLGSWIKSSTSLRHIQTEDVATGEVDDAPNEEMFQEAYNALLGEVHIYKSAQKPPLLSSLLKDYQKELSQEDAVGEDYSDIFIKLIQAARNSSRSHLVEVLNSKGNKGMILNLANLFGAVQSAAGYKAIMSTLDWNKQEDFLPLEKYLQGLATGVRPNEYIIKNLLMLLKNDSIEESKLKETTFLSISSMAQKLHQFKSKSVLYDEIKGYILENLKMCTTNDCKSLFICCLQNLRDISTIPTLLQIALRESQVPSVAAMKALHAFNSKDFTDENRSQLKNILYQTIRRIDSSSRTLALDILLHPDISGEQLTELISILIDNNESYEVKTYFIQRFRMLQQTSRKFNSLAQSIPYISKVLTNYNILSQKGLSTVLQRPYVERQLFNGTLMSTQEVVGGILKRGSVAITFGDEDNGAKIFTLGLYTKGLSSFVSSGDNNNQATDENSLDEGSVTAGLEINVLGSQMRPLIFFNGHGELMGHIWSGTASTPTSAFQSTILVHDTEQFIILQNGMTIHLQLLGANSIDLFGEAQFSLWNRNAHTQITKSSGWTVQKVLSLTIPNAVVQRTVLARGKPDIDLVADIDFYSDIKLCLQLKRTSSAVSVHSSYSLSSSAVPSGSETTASFSYNTPGCTTALNRENNEMCNLIFQDTY